MMLVAATVLTLLLSFTAAQNVVESNPEDEAWCMNSSCYPRWGNLLKGRRVTANSTCGEEEPEEYCLVSNERKEITCDTCDSSKSYKQHPPNYMKDRRIKSRTTWWKAENGVDEVTLQLNLETTFQFTHLIMVFYSFRPGAMVIERSIDYGKTWMPYQYFAYDCQRIFGMRERELGEPDEYGVQRHPDEDVICTSKYSYLEPAQGGEVIYKVIRGRPTNNPNRASLRKLLLLTNLRVRFVKLHTLGDEILDPNDVEAQKKYFYAVEDWVVRGSCFCNGHSDECTAMPGMDAAGSSTIQNMIHGRCVCQHNTAGYNCERCKDFHHALPWMPGDPTTGEPHACQACSCNGHSTTCQFDEQLFRHTGDGGRCTDCQHSTAGPHCDSCVYGYYQVEDGDLTATDICQPCNCNEAGTTSQICASTTTANVTAGTCICKANVEPSAKCDTCKADHYNIDAANPLGCTACGCDPRGVVDGDTTCDLETGQCNCKENVEGRACDRCKAGFFNVARGNDRGCEKCDCTSTGSLAADMCDPLTGACACRSGFTGYACDKIKPGYFVPSIDHWNYNPENEATISGEGYPETAIDSSGTGYVVLPVDSSIEQSTEIERGEEEEPAQLKMGLPTGFYDLKIHHEPAASDYELTLILNHEGRLDGTQAVDYECSAGNGETMDMEPFTSQIIVVTVKAGSTVTRIEDLCMEQGSQYDMNLNLLDTGKGAASDLVIKDLVIVEPLEPEKAFPEDPVKEELYREYQERGCPMSEREDIDIDNECFRIKGELEANLDPNQVVEACGVTVCMPAVDIWNFASDKDNVELMDGSAILIKEGGNVHLPSDSSMTVPLEPGAGGLRDVIITHDPLAKNNLVAVNVTIKHRGNKDGSEPSSYMCNGELIRPYSVTVFTAVKIKKNKQLTSIGDVCLDPKGDYLVTITPMSGSGTDLLLREVVVTYPNEGSAAFPSSPELAELWDTYMREKCPKVAGATNSQKPECIKLINDINENIAQAQVEEDCSVTSCIPYNVIWEPSGPIDNLSGGSYVDPDEGAIVLPNSDAVVELPIEGGKSVTGSLTDILVKHAELAEDQTVIIQVVRTDTDAPHSCGVLQSVPQTQLLTVTLAANTNSTVVSTFCLVEEGTYSVKIIGFDIEEPIQIHEIGSALPANSNAAFPDNADAAQFYQAFLDEGCSMSPEPNTSQECLHLANLIDYHASPERQEKKDCTVELCYPSADVFNPIFPSSGTELSDGARRDTTDGSIFLPTDGKVVLPMSAVLTGPNTVLIDFESNDPPSELTIKITYKGTTDGKNVGEFKCRDETVKPGSLEHTVQLDALNQVQLEACLVENGIYTVQIILTEEDKSININKVTVELPRNTAQGLLPNQPEAEQLVDFLVASCQAQFSGECAAASKALQEAINANNAEYKVDCSKELCLPEENVWDRRDKAEGNIAGRTDSGSVILSGNKYAVFTLDGEMAPKEGLNSLIFTLNPADYNRVVDVVLTPTGLNEDTDYITCEGDVSSAKQQMIRRVIQTNVAFLEVGPVCLDPTLTYDVQVAYKGVQADSGRIYSETSGVNVVIESVDLALPTNPSDAFPDDEEAAEIWEEYVNLQCPRLTAGYREAAQECLDLLSDLDNLMNNVAELHCETTVCMGETGGWKHDPLSDQEVFEGGAVVSGGSKDAVISISPGGQVSISSGEKDIVLPDENVPRTGIMDLVVNHKKSRYSWRINVEVTHTKTKGDDVVPASVTCMGQEIQPFSTQEFEGTAVACSSTTLIPGACLDHNNTYSIKITTMERIGQPIQCAGEVVPQDDGFPLDQVVLVFPSDPDMAFPDDEELRQTYSEYLSNNCGEIESEACDNLDMNIISTLIGEAVGCKCDIRGSTSHVCDSIGGQCPCKDGFTGRRCNLCKPGFYGIETLGTCLPCLCNSYGSISEICDSTGQCPCHPGVLTSSEMAGLRDCSQCIDGFVGLENLGIDGCVRCECGPGAALPNCDETAGTCTCLPGVAQPLCNNCSTGFYDLVPGVGCRACECNSAGSRGLGCDQENGICTCKDNVVGSKCDSCKAGSFSLSEDNPAGCFSCFCSGVTDQCALAEGWKVVSRKVKADWSVLGGAVETRPKYVIGGVMGTEFVWRSGPIGNFYNSYSLNAHVALTGYEDNEVLLRLYRGSTYITAAMSEVRSKQLSVSLYEQNFLDSANAVVSVEEFRFVLSNITDVEITTLYSVSQRHDQKIKGFIMEGAEEKSSGEAAESIELCLCPEGYTGHACGSCVEGYAKSYDGQHGLMPSCVACTELCNGYSDTCDSETGECSDCSGNTAGKHCDSCQEGFYPVVEGDRLSCLACPCSRNAASPSCSIGAGDEALVPVCDACENGYTGSNCLDCAPGYFGSDGQCTACGCNSNIDLSDPYSCNREDGVCLNCLYNTTGVECEKCLPGYYGNALKAELPKCLECACHDLGSLSPVCDEFSGLCDCRENVDGKRCDTCRAGYWNMTEEAGCQECQCDSKGSLSSECDMVTGACQCKNGIQGRRCDECLAGYYNTNSNNSLEFECTACGCNAEGSTSAQCDSTGQCTCQPGIVGVQCDACARGTTGTFPDCVPCGECYDQWEREVEGIEAEIEGLAAKAQNIHLGGANLTEEQLQDIFKEMRQTLREAEKLAKSSPGSNEEIVNMTNTLAQLSSALQDKSSQLDELDGKIDEVDETTAETLASLDQLQDKLDEFRIATSQLAEKAMNLSAANLDEALKLVEDAASRSAAAKQAAAATQAQVQEAEARIRKTEKILSDDIFEDSTTIEKLADIEQDLGDLTDKLGTLDEEVCGTERDDTCGTCGGSQCGFCGGPGCQGAVGIISSIKELADDARSCADQRQERVTLATAELRQQSSKADRIQSAVDTVNRMSEGTKEIVMTTESELQELKRKMDQMMQADRATASQIQEIIAEINALSLPLSEKELSTLVDSLISALNDINLVNTDVEISAPDKARVEDLLQRAKAAKGSANSTLEAILNATAALREFDENYVAAQALLSETSNVVNQGWESIKQIELNTDEAEASRDGIDEALDELEQELQLLISDISNGDNIAQLAQAEIDEATETVQSNDDQVSRLKKDYVDLDELITEKEDLIAEQLDESREGAQLSQQVEDKIAGKIAEVEDLTEKYIIQQNTLTDLNSELDALEAKLEDVMSNIHAKATFHSSCKNDIAS